MEVIKEALIKECGNMFHDKVFIVENLPKKFLYHKTVKMVPRKDREGYMDGTMVPDPNGEMEETLLPGIERSATGDGAYMFWKGTEESELHLKDIDRFIERTLPRDMRIAARVDYAQQNGNAMSPPIPLSQVPRVQLPESELPPAPVPVPPVPAPVAAPSVDKVSQGDRMKKYWEDKKAQVQAKTAN